MIELRKYQLEGCRQIYKFGGRAILGDEQGLGKTIQASYWLLKTPRHRPALIVCPASVKYNWQIELRRFGLRSEVIEGLKPKHLKQMPGEICIINYDILHSWMSAILCNSPKTVIFDEIHFLKNPSARRTKVSRELVELCPARIGLSGTPIPNEIIDLWSPVSIIRPDLFPSRTDFAWRYTKPKQLFGKWVFKGGKNKGELREILYDNLLIRRLKVDVAPELPPKIRKVIPFKLTSYSEYNRARYDFMGWLKSFSPSRAIRAKNNQALVKIGYLMRLVAKLKMSHTIRWITEWRESFGPGEKIVGLSVHTPVLRILAKRFPNCVVVDGSVTGRLRHEAVLKFTNDRKTEYLWGNWIAAGTGLNLQVASHFVGLDLPMSPGVFSQGEDRIHRIGQTKNAFYYYLIALHTAEEKLMKIHRTKLDNINGVIGRSGDNEDDELDVFGQLLQELEEN